MTSTEKQKIIQCIDDIEVCLGMMSGATSYQLRKAAYYCVISHLTYLLDILAPLCMHADSGVGKTSLMDAMQPFCYNSHSINVGTSTAAAIREAFHESNPGTVFAEECEDELIHADAKAHLQNRYARTTAKAAKMEKNKEGYYVKKEYITFGATVIHRRDHFEDQAMENRALWLEIQLNKNRPKSSYYKNIPEELVKPIFSTLENFKLDKLPELNIPEIDKLPGRVIDTYEPFLALAQLLDDKDFLHDLANELHIANAALEDGKAFTPKIIVFKSLLGCLTANDVMSIKSVSVEKDICKYIQTNFLKGIMPVNAVKYLLELGFERNGHLRLSGGVTKVTNITFPFLAKICQQLGIQDDALANALKANPPVMQSKTKFDFDLE